MPPVQARQLGEQQRKEVEAQAARFEKALEAEPESVEALEVAPPLHRCALHSARCALHPTRRRRNGNVGLTLPTRSMIAWPDSSVELLAARLRRQAIAGLACDGLVSGQRSACLERGP